MAFTSMLAKAPDPMFEGTDRASGLNVRTPLGVSIKLSGHKRLGEAFESLDGAIRSAASFGALRAAQEIWKRSRAQVPYDTGELYNSADGGPKKVEYTSKAEAEWLVVYDADYAWYVHETYQDYEQKTGRTSGLSVPQEGRTRGAKFLEEPMNEVAALYPDWVAQEIDAVVKPITPSNPPSMRPRLVRRS